MLKMYNFENSQKNTFSNRQWKKFSRNISKKSLNFINHSYHSSVQYTKPPQKKILIAIKTAIKEYLVKKKIPKQKKKTIQNSHLNQTLETLALSHSTLSVQPSFYAQISSIAELLETKLLFFNVLDNVKMGSIASITRSFSQLFQLIVSSLTSSISTHTDETSSNEILFNFIPPPLTLSCHAGSKWC